MALKLNIENLLTLGVAITGHGEDVAMRWPLTAASRPPKRLGGPLLGLDDTRPAAWSATITALLTWLSNHAQTLHTCAQEFSATEDRHAQAVEAPGRQAISSPPRCRTPGS